MKTLRLDPVSLSTNPRATLSSWQYYSPLVYAAHAAHPQTFSYECLRMTPNTVSSRLRDAIRGMLAFSYPSSVPHETLLSWYSEVVIRFDSTHVHIGPKVPLEEVLEVNIHTLGALEFDELSLPELEAFALLLSHGKIQGPIIVKTGEFSSLLPNLIIKHREDGALILL